MYGVSLFQTAYIRYVIFLAPDRVVSLYVLPYFLSKTIINPIKLTFQAYGFLHSNCQIILDYCIIQSHAKRSFINLLLFANSRGTEIMSLKAEFLSIISLEIFAIFNVSFIVEFHMCFGIITTSLSLKDR